MVKRVSFNEIPPRVQYSLTPKGNSVLAILESICK
ncbi:MAG: winged helix-turn-helix transcriptional regulator [Campylobacter sp.]|nr:winged helix-turn-helix transcriptional regulator [Campylobacter sp.]